VWQVPSILPNRRCGNSATVFILLKTSHIWRRRCPFLGFYVRGQRKVSGLDRV
jgi:hypothetical protein